MAISLVFKDDENHELELYANTELKLHIRIEHDGLPALWINLGKTEAIKLSKEIKKQIHIINTAEKKGGNNG